MMDDAARAAMLRRQVAALLENWAEAGWDRERSGFHEKLDAALRPVPGGRRRLLTCARQLYLWSRGPAIAGLPPRRDLADAAYHYLRDRFRDRRHGGFWFSVDLDGQPLDRRKDLYGHAFVLFALAHYHACFGDPAALELARETDDMLRRHLVLPQGWLAASAEADWRQPETALAQNPHMHLFEAYLALGDVDRDPRWRQGTDEMVALFTARLFDAGPGVLGEFYDQRGVPHPETGGIVEPGHHFEWSWLLQIDAEQRSARPNPAAERLFDWAIRFGVDAERGGIYDRLDRSGGVLLDTKRIWPLCEGIKAYAARWRCSGAPAMRDGMVRWLDFLAAHYLRPDGKWLESLDRDLGPALTDMPGTTPYHLLMTIAEILPILEAS
jgi:mannose/cellobiose epimerase-like protein (N-acyl-D-glucosamine 2-epimerase family)